MNKNMNELQKLIQNNRSDFRENLEIKNENKNLQEPKQAISTKDQDECPPEEEYYDIK